ncbi:FkbM family methyltransferase [Methylobacterium mesophilicum]
MTNNLKHGQKTDSRYGNVSLLGSDDLVSRSIIDYGEWAYLEVIFLSQFVDSQSYIWDLGAFIGSFSLGIAQFKPGYLLSVEADRGTFQYLEENIISNIKTNYTLLNKACGPMGVTHGSMRRDDPSNSGANNVDFCVDGDVDTVEVISLDRLLGEFGSPTLIKIDIEESEFLFLGQHVDWLRKCSVNIYMECNEALSSFECAKLFLEAGRDVYFFSFPAFNLANYSLNPTVFLPGAHEAGLLTVPRGHKVELRNELIESECRLKSISSLTDLAQALHLTPRWAPAALCNLSRPELLAWAAQTGVSGEKILGFDRLKNINSFDPNRESRHGEADKWTSRMFPKFSCLNKIEVLSSEPTKVFDLAKLLSSISLDPGASNFLEYDICEYYNAYASDLGYAYLANKKIIRDTAGGRDRAESWQELSKYVDGDVLKLRGRFALIFDVEKYSYKSFVMSVLPKLELLYQIYGEDISVLLPTIPEEFFAALERISVTTYGGAFRFSRMISAIQQVETLIVVGARVNDSLTITDLQRSTYNKLIESFGCKNKTCNVVHNSCRNITGFHSRQSKFAHHGLGEESMLADHNCKDVIENIYIYSQALIVVGCLIDDFTNLVFAPMLKHTYIAMTTSTSDDTSKFFYGIKGNITFFPYDSGA